MSFAEEVDEITQSIAKLLKEKNARYGDSALNPVRVFSKSDTLEQLNVRIDDKLSRLARGTGKETEDVITDLIGYLIMHKIAVKRLEKYNGKSMEKDEKAVERAGTTGTRRSEDEKSFSGNPSDEYPSVKILDGLGRVKRIPGGYRPGDPHPSSNINP